MKGSRISKDNTPKDQMANILKEELQAQAAETPAVKIAGSVGRYSNVEYWQQKSETFKQQVRGARRRCRRSYSRAAAAQQCGPHHRSTGSKGAHARVPQPNYMGVTVNRTSRVLLQRRGCASPPT